MNIPFQTRRGDSLVLRSWHHDDLDRYEDLMRGDARWLLQESPWLHDTLDPGAAVQAKRTELEEAQGEGFPMSLVIAPQKDDEFIGFVSSYWRGKQTHWMRIGVRIYDPSHWGKGIGCGALRVWTTALFRAHDDLVRLGMTTWSGNLGMVKLAQKLGFIQEACHRQARRYRGDVYDALGFGVLRSEWTHDWAP